jgi:hypothetical protein
VNVGKSVKNVFGKAFKSRKTRFGILGVVAVFIVVAMIATGIANVVLTYVVFNNVAANATSQYDFVNGGNYGTANGLGLITNAITAPANQLTTTLSGVEYVTAEIYDVARFDTSAVTTTTSHVSAVTVVNSVVVAPANVVCAYAFVMDAVPGVGTVAVAGAPAGCGAVTPTIGATASACTAGGTTTAVATINLLAGTVVGTPGTCNIPTAAAAGLIIEYICFAIYTNGVVGAAALNTIGVTVGAP